MKYRYYDIATFQVNCPWSITHIIRHWGLAHRHTGSPPKILLVIFSIYIRRAHVQYLSTMIRDQVLGQLLPIAFASVSRFLAIDMTFDMADFTPLPVPLDFIVIPFIALTASVMLPFT